MAYDQYDIFFSGAILPDHEPAAVRAAVGRLFKADGAKLERLFSGKRICIRHAVDVETAGRYRAAMREAGALIEIRESGRPDAGHAPAPAPEAPDAPSTAGIDVADDGPDFELLPARSGSLADCAPPDPPPPAVDLSGMQLAAPGTTMDESEPPPGATIDTTHLSMAPPQSGSLEDCAAPAPARPLPDITHLELVDEAGGKGR